MDWREIVKREAILFVFRFLATLLAGWTLYFLFRR
jgi:hypothetical protein